MFRLLIFSCWLLANFVALARGRQSAQERILGGHDTDITEVPYQVSVQYNGSHVCGGSIIGAKYVLTAAQCFEDKDEDLFSVRAGSNYHNKGGQEVKVVKVISHQDYDKYKVDYDVAILVLKEPLTCSEGVQSAILTTDEPKKGESVLVSGWGSLGEGKGMSDLLQSATVTVVSREDCKEMYRSRDEITDQMFCASHPKGEKDSCEGDNGGPAVMNGKLVGIVSWSDGCGNENVPGVYTNVAEIVDWVTEQTQE